MWADRHSFHHLRPSVESDQQKLEATARYTLTLLNDLERVFFGFTLREGMVVPDHPEFWSIKEGESPVFMVNGERVVPAVKDGFVRVEREWRRGVRCPVA